MRALEHRTGSKLDSVVKSLYIVIETFNVDGTRIIPHTMKEVIKVPVEDIKEEYTADNNYNYWKYIIDTKYTDHLRGFDSATILTDIEMRARIADVHEQMVQLDKEKHMLLNIL